MTGMYRAARGAIHNIRLTILSIGETVYPQAKMLTSRGMAIERSRTQKR